MSRFIRFAAVAAALLITSCVAENPTGVPVDLEAAFDISDGANGGEVDGFFWLTPTLKKGPKNFSGTFDPNLLSLNPMIHICQINGTAGDGSDACIGPPLVTLSGSSQPEIIRVDLGSENYSVTWQSTNGNIINAGGTYRAVMSVGGVELGWVDLEAVAKQRDLKRVGNGFAGFVVGIPFLFKVRVETGIAGSVVVTPPGQMIFDANTAGESADFTATVSDLYGNPLPGRSVDWGVSPSSPVSVVTPTGPTDGLGQSTTTVSSDGQTPVAGNTTVTVTAQVGAASGSEDLLVKPSLGTLKVVKNADADGDFDFSATGGIGTFQISTTGAPSSTGDKSFSLLHTSTYDVTETPLNSDFDFQSSSCTLEGGGATGTPGGTGVTGIVVEPGKTTTCTFTNSLKPGFIKVVKNSDADGSFDYTGDLGAFTLTTTGAPTATDMQTFTGLDATQTYDITETPNPAFDFTGVSCTLQGGASTGTAGGTGITGVAVQPGKTTTCTFTNSQKLGAIEVVKNSDVDGSFDFTGSGGIGGFTLTTTGGGPSTAMQTFAGLDPNATYDLSETLNPNFDFQSAACVLDGGGSTGTPGGTGVTGIVVEAGKTTTCTFSNTLKPGAIKVVKNSNADGSFGFTGDLGNFTLNTTGGGPSTDMQTFVGLDATSTFDITESSSTGFSFVSVACTLQGGASTGTPGASTVTGVAVEPGKTTTCTFTNAKVDNAPTVVSTTPADAAIDIAIGSNIIVNFSEAVNATTSSFTIECPAPGNLQTYALSASPASSFTLDPNADLPLNTTCTVTVVAAQVTDVDAFDPPDNMTSDFTFSFTTTAALPVDAIDDIYSEGVIGNVSINSDNFGGGAFSVLDNDFSPGSKLVSAFDATSANGGTVVMDADGTFTYDPPPGFEGTDTWNYTMSNGVSTDAASVQVTVADLIWFVDNTAGAGDGRLNTPFNSLAAYNSTAADDPGDVIFIHESITPYDGGITILDNQVLVGQDATADLPTITGITPSASSAPLPTMNPLGTPATTLVNSSGDGITLAQNNTVRGLTVGNTTGVGFLATSFGTVMISDVSLIGSGDGVDMTGGNMTMTFDQLSSSSGTRGIELDNVSGFFGVTSGSLSGHTSHAVRIQNSSGIDFDYSGSIDSGAEGIDISTSPGGSFSFSGPLNLNTGPNTAFSATGGGTVEILGTANTITNGAAPAVNINGTTIGPNGITFQSISSNGGSKGIILDNAGSGGFTVTGTGTTDGSGGTIQNKTNRGIEVINTDNVIFSNVELVNASTTSGGVCTGLDNSGCSAAIHLSSVVGASFSNVDITGTTVQQGINGLNVTDLTLNALSEIRNVGNQVNEGGVRLFNLDGTVMVDGVIIDGSFERNFFVHNSFGAPKTLTMTFQNSNSDDAGADGLEIELLNNTTLDLDVTGSVFSGNNTNGIQVISAGNSIVNSLDIIGNQIDPGTGIGRAIDLNTNNTGTMNFNITGNTRLWSDGGNAVNVTAFAGSSISGRINNNTDIRTDVTTTNAQSGGSGVRVAAEEQADIVIEINGNTISNIFQDNGIQVLARADLNAGTAGRVDATINGNSVTLQAGAAFPLYGIETRAQEANTVCANVVNNAVTLGFGVAAFRARTSAASSTLLLEGFTTDAATTWTNNGNTGTPVSSSHNGTLGGGTCTTPSHP